MANRTKTRNTKSATLAPTPSVASNHDIFDTDPTPSHVSMLILDGKACRVGFWKEEAIRDVTPDQAKRLNLSYSQGFGWVSLQICDDEEFVSLALEDAGVPIIHMAPRMARRLSRVYGDEAVLKILRFAERSGIGHTIASIERGWEALQTLQGYYDKAIIADEDQIPLPSPRGYRVTAGDSEIEFLARPGLTLDQVLSEIGKPDRYGDELECVAVWQGRRLLATVHYSGKKPVVTRFDQPSKPDHKAISKSPSKAQPRSRAKKKQTVELDAKFDVTPRSSGV